MLKRFLRGSASIALANGLSKGFALAFLVLAGRALGLEEFGRLALILSLGIIVSTLPATGFPQALLWRLGVARDGESRQTALAVAFVGTALLALVASLAVMALPGLPSLVVALVVAESATYLYLNLHLGLLNHLQVTLFSAGRNLAKLLLLAALLVSPLGDDLNHAHIILVYLLAPLLVMGLVEAWRPSGVALRPAALSKPCFRQMGRYALPLIGSAAAMAVLLQGDVAVLEYYHGEATTSSYFAAKRLLLPVLLLPVAVRGLLIPSLAGGKLLPGQMRRLIALVMAFTVVVATGAGLAGPWLVAALYGTGFTVARSLTLLLATAASLLALRELLVALLLARGLSARVLFADLAAMVVALTGYLLLVPDKGAEGAATSLLAGALVAVAASFTLMWHLRRADVSAEPS